MHVTNEVKLDPQSPIPMDFGMFSAYSNNGNAYIPFLNPGDNFFNILAEARSLSVTHNACITTKTDYTVGEGIIASQNSNSADATAFQEWAKYVNNRRESLHNVLRKVVDGYLEWGNQPVEIVRLMIGKKKFLFVYPKNTMDCRLSWPDDNDEVKSVIISKVFRANKDGRRTFIYDPQAAKDIPLYKRGPGNKDQYWKKDETGNAQRTMLWLKNEVAGYDYYGMPSSVSSINYQKAEYDGIRYNLDNLDNNMVLGGAIFLTGNMPQDEADKVATSIIRRHTGKGKRGRVGVFSSEAGIADAKWVPFDTQKEGSYIELDNKIQDKIIFANQWDAVLAGLQNDSALGKGSGYLEQIYNQKMKTVIRPLQKKILEDFISTLLEIADDWFGTNWSSLELDIQPAQIPNNTSELTGSSKGVQAFLSIVTAVSNGSYPLEAAIKLVQSRFGLSEQEAKEQLGNINVRSIKNGKTNTNQPAGGNQ